MTSDQLGRRYERLLFLSAPLTVVAVIILLVTFSSTTQNERVLAKCIGVAIKTLQDNREKLDDQWNEYVQEKKKSKYFVNYYKTELIVTWIAPGVLSGCLEEVKPLLEQGAETPPGKLIEDLGTRVDQLRDTPLQFRGIEIPEKAEVSMLVTNIKIHLESLAALLQISLAPILIIWLGSLYHTRHHESVFIGKANDISTVFPHLINVYPAIDFPTLKKRSRLAYLIPPAIIVGTIYSLTRVGLIAFVILPAIGCYLASLFILPIEGIIWVSFLSGLLVTLFALTVVIVELLPWHIVKVFPGVAKK